MCYCAKHMPSKNHFARNMQILQVFILLGLQELALNLAHILHISCKFCIKNATYKNLARILQEQNVR